MTAKESRRILEVVSHPLRPVKATAIGVNGVAAALLAEMEFEKESELVSVMNHVPISLQKKRNALWYFYHFS